MKTSKPYQPLLFRILHNATALIALLAIVTSFIVYNTYDGRLLQIPLPKISNIIGIHGTFGLFFLLILPVFAIYSFHAGQKRLIQPDSFKNLSQIGKPSWWYSLQRITNTLMLFAATFAVITGRMMQEKWLPNGDLNETWYLLHLTSWIVLVTSFALHLLMSSKVGGIPLLLSIFQTKIHDKDSPRHWTKKIKAWLHRPHL
ncbi:MAG TPA: cytochrome b/b6 domain-containing protein [Halomicronema sp.]